MCETRDVIDTLYLQSSVRGKDVVILGTGAYFLEAIILHVVGALYTMSESRSFSMNAGLHGVVSSINASSARDAGDAAAFSCDGGVGNMVDKSLGWALCCSSALSSPDWSNMFSKSLMFGCRASPGFIMNWELGVRGEGANTDPRPLLSARYSFVAFDVTVVLLVIVFPFHRSDDLLFDVVELCSMTTS
jgi:hypothetical protein